MVTRQEIEILKQVIVPLEPCEYLIKEKSAENYLTLSKVVIMINCLSTILRKLTSHLHKPLQVLKFNTTRCFKHSPGSQV